MTMSLDPARPAWYACLVAPIGQHLQTKEATDMNSIINRHMARLLKNLEDAGCPAIYKDAVKAEFVWLRSDLIPQGNERHDDLIDTDGNR